MKARSIRKTINAKSSSIGFSLIYMRRVKRQNRYGSFAVYDLFSGLSTTGYIRNIKSQSTRENYIQNLMEILSRYTKSISHHSKSIGRLIRWSR